MGSIVGEPITVRPIGVVVGGRLDPVDDNWAGVVAQIVVDGSRFTADALAGLDDFSHVEVGLDAVDGSPVLDLKPYMAEFAPRSPFRQPAWSHELMSDYWHAE